MSHTVTIGQWYEVDHYYAEHVKIVDGQHVVVPDPPVEKKAYSTLVKVQSEDYAKDLQKAVDEGHARPCADLGHYYG